MKNNKDLYKEVISFLQNADKEIWEAVMVIDNSDNLELKKNIEPLMELRGEIMVEFLFKFYKKYPNLKPKYEISNKENEEMEEIFKAIFKKE